MNILVINGSPAGEDSITLQTVEYINRLFPEHGYVHLNAGQQIKTFENDFSKAETQIQNADLLIFCYPVYTFLAPAQLHRFIELIKERHVPLEGKYATQITTSKHFYDITAHEFIRENCLDLGLRYINGLSADMDDLLGEKGRSEAEEFFRHLVWSVENGRGETGKTGGGVSQELCRANVPEGPGPEKKEGRVAVVADLAGDDGALNDMIERFKAVCPYECSVVDIGEFPFAGGCLGCFSCASDGKCIYKDGFDTLLRDKIQTADATVYAFTVRDHSMGSRFKLFDDRQFCNGHRTVTMGKPVGYLINGRLIGEPNLRTLMEARSQVGGNYLAGTAVNETDPDVEIDDLVKELGYAIENGYSQPANFYGVGGMKIFRDLIYQMQGLMREDHRFYKEHGFYDFPQKRRGRIVGMYLVGSLMNSKKLKKKMGGRMTKGMLRPYRKVVEEAGPTGADTEKEQGERE